MAKKWFHFPLPIFIEAEESLVKEKSGPMNSIEFPNELLDGISELNRKHFLDDTKLMVFTKTRFLPAKTPPKKLIDFEGRNYFNCFCI